jgi:integrase
MVKENVFQWVKPAREEEKTRRAFTDDEKRAVAAEIEKTDYWMFRGVLLQYFCYIRPIELTRLRFRDFDLGAGTVTVEVHKGKAHKRFATIPASIMHYFVDGKFDAYPGNHFVFWACENRKGPIRRFAVHRGVLRKQAVQTAPKSFERLRDRGDIRDIEGLTWYSWKDTGISRNANETSPLSTRDQAGHSSFDMTLKYYRAPRVIPEYKDLPNDLL